MESMHGWGMWKIELGATWLKQGFTCSCKWVYFGFKKFNMYATLVLLRWYQLCCNFPQYMTPYRHIYSPSTSRLRHIDTYILHQHLDYAEAHKTAKSNRSNDKSLSNTDSCKAMKRPVSAPTFGFWIDRVSSHERFAFCTRIFKRSHKICKNLSTFFFFFLQKTRYEGLTH